MRKMQRIHGEEEEDQEEEDIIPNFEIDDSNGDANGLEYENEMTKDEVLQTCLSFFFFHLRSHFELKVQKLLYLNGICLLLVTFLLTRFSVGTAGLVLKYFPLRLQASFTHCIYIYIYIYIYNIYIYRERGEIEIDRYIVR